MLELHELMGDPEDERNCVIRSIKRIFEVNTDYYEELCSFLSNELVTYGFGPESVFEPFLQGLFSGASWQELACLTPPYERLGWGQGGVYNVSDLQYVLSLLKGFHPSIPINGWESGDEYEADDFFTSFSEPSPGVYFHK
jgi:hypothetical protein